MKILIVTEALGKTATGIVAKRVALGLSRHSNVDVLTASDYTKEDEKKRLDRIFISPIRQMKGRLTRMSFTIFRKDILNSRWPNGQLQELANDYDLIFSCVSYGHYCPLTCIPGLKKANPGARIFSYFVDAIPAPDSFMKSSKYKKALASFIRTKTQGIDVIFSTCQEMSDYQKHVSSEGPVFCELKNPSPYEEIMDLGPVQNKKNVFVYAGRIYMPRTPEYVLDAFESFLKDYPDSELHFVGSGPIPGSLKHLQESTKARIITAGYKEDISIEYKSATALIDIGSDVPDDVFLSSKISGYMPYNRYIISESTVGSPARRIFRDDSSVFLCGHDSKEIRTAMERSVKEARSITMVERERILSSFSISAVTDRIMEIYNSLIR